MEHQDILNALTENLRRIDSALAILRGTRTHRNEHRKKAVWTPSMRRAAAARMRKRMAERWGKKAA